MSDEFVYESLKEGEFRLLRLQWSAGASGKTVYPAADGSIECNIATFRLGESPPFTALSYTWGNDDAHVPLKLNGFVKVIKDNLRSFLLQARPQSDTNKRPHSGLKNWVGTKLNHSSAQIKKLWRHKTSLNSKNAASSDGPQIRELKQNAGPSGAPYSRRDANPKILSRQIGYFWVDALCINQNNVLERNAQVSIMRDIYASSKRIIIWLGSEDSCGHGELALDTYRYYSQRYRRKNSRSKSSPIEIPSNQTEAIECLASRDYWFRSWIIQEATTPYVPKEVWCGSRIVALIDVEFVHELLFDWAADRQAMIRPGENKQLDYLKEVTAHRQEHIENADGDNGNLLLKFLLEGRKFKASEPRDKVYAFLGIYSDASQLDGLPFMPDY